jgi:NTE family protein
MRIGIALGGGGAKGVAHIGVLRVLESARVPIHIVAGTSAGAIAGALYAAGKTPDEIERVIRRLTLRQLLTRDRSGMGLFSTDGIRRLIEAEIGKETRIEDLPRAFVAIAVDMDSGDEIAFDSGLIADAVCASAAFPGLFAPVRVNGRCYFDGGVMNPVPFDAVRRRGADRVLAVDLGADDPVFTVGPARHRRGDWFYRLLFVAGDQKIMRVASRAIGIMSKQMRLEKMRQSPPDLVLYPNVQSVGLLDFDLADECIVAGDQAARDALPQIEQIVMSPRWRYQSQKLIERIRGGLAARLA